MSNNGFPSMTALLGLLAVAGSRTVTSSPNGLAARRAVGRLKARLPASTGRWATSAARPAASAACSAAGSVS